MVDLYPLRGPIQEGHLEVSSENRIAWQVFGVPHGKPAVVLHGGPGQGCAPNMARAFDPEQYRVVLFDQRGCGRSIPSASDLATDMSCNTTDHLIADMESLRRHLGIERWLVSGASWGVALALAYAHRHRESVSELVLSNVTTWTRREAEWLYAGAARFFPEAWEQFRGPLPNTARGADLIEAYAQRMDHPEEAVRVAAARGWCKWEDAVLSLETGAGAASSSEMPVEDMLAFVRICTHYLRHGGWLEEGALIQNAARLDGIPGVVIHGRRDMSCPIDTAWALARAWAGAELIAVDDAGHLRSNSKRLALMSALDRFATG
ncbi:MAG: prolyl aminopeptidase [Myxococcales bacterium]